MREPACRYLIDLDAGRCVACSACAVACMDQNDLEPQGPFDMFRKISTTEEGHGAEAIFTYLSLSCMHCAKAPCINACPCGCIFKDLETGLTVYDNANCIGCRSCSLACPFGAPVFTSDGKMTKCDGCNERVKRGLEPACVSICPFGALTLTDEAGLAEKKAAHSTALIAKSISGE